MGKYGPLPLSLLFLANTRRAIEFVRRRTAGRRQAEAARTGFYEQIWREAANLLGADFVTLDRRVQQIRLGTRTTNVCCNYTELDGPVTLRLAGNKALVHRLLRQAGLPVPDAVEFSLETLSRAREFLNQSSGPCVVKPARNTGAGEGITTGITHRGHLLRSAVTAAAFCRDLLLEQQVAGDNYRLLFLDGLLLDAVHRQPPRVCGDGRSTIAQLVRQNNTRRLAGGADVSQALLQRDGDMHRTLAAQGLSLQSVVPSGVQVIVKTVINDNAAEENVPVTERICPEIVDDARRAVATIGGRLIGVDVITTDPARPLRSTGGVILELNTTPGFYYHYARSSGICPVAVHVLSCIFGLHLPAAAAGGRGGDVFGSAAGSAASAAPAN